MLVEYQDNILVIKHGSVTTLFVFIRKPRNYKSHGF